MKTFLIVLCSFIFVIFVTSTVMHSKGMIKEEEVCKGLYFADKTQCLWEKENRSFAIDDAVKTIGGKVTLSEKLDATYKFFEEKAIVYCGKYKIVFSKKDKEFIFESIQNGHKL